jgi:hypothetical protein
MIESLTVFERSESPDPFRHRTDLRWITNCQLPR